MIPSSEGGGVCHWVIPSSEGEGCHWMIPSSEGWIRQKSGGGVSLGDEDVCTPIFK